MSDTIDYDLENFKHLKYLKANLYPTLNQALEILMERLIKTNEVQQHQERLKQKKIRDRLEQKRIEKEKLKEELGSDYVSSDEDDDSFRDDDRPDGYDDGPLTTGEENPFDPHIVAEKPEEENINKGTGSLAPILEEEDAQESPERLDESQAAGPPQKVEFNPIQFLAATLKKIQNGDISIRDDSTYSGK